MVKLFVAVSVDSITKGMSYLGGNTLLWKLLILIIIFS